MDRKMQERTWLRYWNPENDLEEMSCRTATEIMYYCMTPAHQTRTLYRTGHLDGCKEQFSDVPLCFKIMGVSARHKDRAQRMLNEGKPQPKREPHVWRMRKQPPSYWRAPWEVKYNIEKTTITKEPSSSASSTQS